MKFWFLQTLLALVQQDLDLVFSDIRVKLLMSGNDAIAKRATAEYLTDLTLNEYDGTGYAEYAPGTPTVIADATDLRVEIGVPAGSFGSAVSAATIPAAGYLVYDANSNRVLGYNETGFPLNGDGGPFTLTPDAAAGLLSLA